MALLQRKPQVSTSAPVYTLGLGRTVMIVGLGNIGREYDKTRHNLGFMTLDNFAEVHEFPGWLSKKDLKSSVTSQVIGDVKVILVKPETMMNLSGEAVQLIANFYKISAGNIVVIHDELDVDFGQIRMRAGGGAAGHNGIKSIIQHLNDEFGRIRIGIKPVKPTKMEMSDYVLSRLNSSEQKLLPNMFREVNSILVEFIYRGDLQPETRSFIV